MHKFEICACTIDVVYWYYVSFKKNLCRVYMKSGVDMKMRYSIIVPTLNPGNLWQKWVEALKLQSIAPSVVYVIDSGTTDGSVAMSIDAGFSVSDINKAEFNHGGTRQRALNSVVNVEYVILLTQDAVLADPDSIRNILVPFLDHRVSAVCGRQLPRPDAGNIEAHSRIYNYSNQSSVATFEDRKSVGIKAAFLSNSFAAYRITSLLQVGGFPENVIFGEDMYVAAKLLKAGYKIAYAADACVYHSHNYGLLQEFKRYFDMGVFHACEPWIRKEFGGAEGEGVKFVVSELKYLLRHAFWRVPEAMLRTVFRYTGFRLGLVEKRLPLRLKKRLAMNAGFFK